MKIVEDTVWEPIVAHRSLRKRSNLNGHKVNICECGKLAYRSREQAQDALRVARHQRATAVAAGRATRRNEDRAYRHGNFWHLTSIPAWVEVSA